LLVPGDQQLPPPINGADRIVRTHLGSLVENNEVELEVRRLQVCADCQGTHHQARLEPREDRGDGGEQFAEWEVPAFLLDLAAENALFGRRWGRLRGNGPRAIRVAEQPVANPGWRPCDEPLVQFLETMDKVFVPFGPELAKGGCLLVNRVQPEAQEASTEGAGSLLHLDLPTHYLIQNRGNSCLFQFLASFAKPDPFEKPGRV